MVDKGQDGELLKRIRGLRKKFASDIGFLAAPVHIRDNLELKPNAYRIVLKGVEIGTGNAFPGQFMAINPGRVSGPLAGRETTDPAFGLPAVWIDASQREQAHALGYTVVDASTVVATHLNHLILSHAPELLGRTETQALLDHIAKDSPKLVEDLVPKLLPLATVQRVLQNLLDEGVNIRDMRTIIEVLAEFSPRIQDPLELTTRIRQALGRAIVQGSSRATAKSRSWRSIRASSACSCRPWLAAGRKAAPSSPALPKPCCAKPLRRPSAWRISACRRCCWCRRRCAGCCRASCAAACPASRSCPTPKCPRPA
jgi:flagellar biosynthesis protein FlhA